MSSDRYSFLEEGALNSFYYLFFGFFGYLIMFLFNILGARYFGSVDWGLYSLANTILRFSLLLASLGVFVSLPVFIPEYLAKKDSSLLKGLLLFSSLLPFFFSLIIGSLLFFFAEDLTSFFGYPPLFSSLLRVVAFLLVLKVFQSFFRKLFVALKRFLLLNFLYAFLDRFFLLVALLVVWFFNKGLFSFFLLLLVSYSLLFLLSLRFSFSFFSSLLADDSPVRFSFSSWVSFSFPLFFSGVFAFFLSWSDNLVIGKFLDPSSLAVYAVAFSVANFLLFIQGAFSSVITPYLSSFLHSKRFSEFGFFYRKFSAWVFGLSFPVFIVLVLYSKEFLRLFFGREFVAGYLPLMIIASGMLINFSLGLNSSVITIFKKTNLLFILNSSLALFNILLNIFLVNYWGIIGVAFATALTMVINQLLLFFYARKFSKEEGLGLSLSLDWVYYIKFVIAGFLSSSIAVFVYRALTNHLLGILVSGLLYLLLYILFLFLLKTFKEDDLRIFSLLEKKAGLNLGFVKRFLKRLL